jgi:hypothetical protein
MTHRFVPVAVLAAVVSMMPGAGRAVAGTQLACRFKGLMYFNTVYDDSRAGGGIAGIGAGGTLPGTCVVGKVKPTVEQAVADFNVTYGGFWVDAHSHSSVPAPGGVTCDISADSPTGQLTLGFIVRTKSSAIRVDLVSFTDWPGVNGETPVTGTYYAGLWSQSIFGACPVTIGYSPVSLAFAGR